MHYELDTTQIEVYNELVKRRTLVGVLSYDRKSRRFSFVYEIDYLRSRSAIPLGPELPIHKITHQSKRDELFPSFLDRIPDKQNPAYPEYCRSQEISPDETNPIILLATIGRRGPSTLVFEPVYKKVGTVAEELKQFREELDLTRWDFAQAFGFSELTIYKVENGQTKDTNILRLIHFYITESSLALFQLNLTGKKVHAQTRTKLYRYYRNQKELK